MGYQVMMIRGSATSPVASISMLAFLMTCIVQTLRYDAPLYGEVAISVDGQTLVDRPADGAMVDDDVLTATASQTITLMMSHLTISQSKTHVANDVVGSNGYRVVCQTDSIAGSRLSCHRRVWREPQRRFQEDGS